MTLASTLFGGGSAADYVSGALYKPNPETVGGVSTADEDNLVPFYVRKTVIVDKVAWYRDNTNAGNAYVGIYSLAGTLLTDCAVDSNTTVGWHLVDTTNITLIAGRIYFACINLSADIAGTQDANTTTVAPSRSAEIGELLGLGITGATSAVPDLAYVKSRANAALLSSLTMTGWATDAFHPAVGFIAA